MVLAITLLAQPSNQVALANRSDFAIGIDARFFFSAPGSVRVVQPSAAAGQARIIGQPVGLPPHVFRVLSGAVLSTPTGRFDLELALPRHVGGSVVLSSADSLSSAEAALALVAANREKELARYRGWEELAEAKEQIQTVLSWNAIWVPYERGTLGCKRTRGTRLATWHTATRPRGPWGRVRCDPCGSPTATATAMPVAAEELTVF